MSAAELVLWGIAVAGAALVLTQSSITRPLREGLAALEKKLAAVRLAGRPVAVDYGTHAAVLPSSRGRARAAVLAPVHHGVAVLAKLTACPMCSGFWIGAASARWIGVTSIAWIVLCGFAGSLSSALGVAAWLWAGETTAAFGLWRYLHTPPVGVHHERMLAAAARGTTPDAIVCPRPDCGAVGGKECVFR